MRAVIDTNLLVAAMISRPGSTSRKLLEAVRDGRVTLVLSQPIIDEFRDVMSRPKPARYGITIGAVLDFLEGCSQSRRLFRLRVRHEDATIQTMTP